MIVELGTIIVILFMGLALHLDRPIPSAKPWEDDENQPLEF